MSVRVRREGSGEGAERLRRLSEVQGATPSLVDSWQSRVLIDSAVAYLAWNPLALVLLVHAQPLCRFLILSGAIAH